MIGSGKDRGHNADGLDVMLWIPLFTLSSENYQTCLPKPNILLKVSSLAIPLCIYIAVLER